MALTEQMNRQQTQNQYLTEHPDHSRLVASQTLPRPEKKSFCCHIPDKKVTMKPKLDFVHFCTLSSGRDALMRNFNSQDGVFKPILGIKITPEGIPIQNKGHKNVQSREKDFYRC